MSEFFVGQQVVCVNDMPAPGTVWLDGERPTRGALYTVTRVFISTPGKPSIGLKEIDRHPVARRALGDIGYGVRRFRPLESKAISLFRKIARDVTEGRKVEFVE